MFQGKKKSLANNKSLELSMRKDLDQKVFFKQFSTFVSSVVNVSRKYKILPNIAPLIRGDIE